MVSATIIKDSINYLGSRITTLVLEYPRYIHAEFMTHRILSKNSASSRAIPVNKMIENVKNNTVYPTWTLNEKGMQGDMIKNEAFLDVLNEYIKVMRDETIGYIQTLSTLNVHKQNANRYLEPFQHIKIICTGTDWNNFFDLRCHKDAQPEIQSLAQEIRHAMENNQPKKLNEGEWHIPFEDFLPDGISIEDKIKIAVARCARISYNNFDTNSMDVKKDIDLYEKLIVQEPAHLSPTEHIAKVPTHSELDFFSSMYISNEVGKYTYHRGRYVSNLNGYIQYRKILESGQHVNNRGQIEINSRPLWKN